MDEKKPKERIVLRGNQQTEIAVGISHGGKNQIDPGDKIAVASSAATIISARFNPETGLIDVVPIEGALGPSDVSVTITLADGTVLPPQVVEYEVIHPHAEAVTLTPGAVVDKQTVITVPRPNPEPHVVPDASPPDHPPPTPDETMVESEAAPADDAHDHEAHPHGRRRHHGKS